MKNQFAANSNRIRVLIFCTCLLSVACAGVIVSAENQTSTLPQTPAPEKTVEQVQKNIQILKGLPQSQLVPVMNFVSVSLGVKCNFCHVEKDGTWDFASDEKEHKVTAREMIKMLLNINKTTFKGATEVTCNTCHRGRSHPASGVPFPLPPPAAPAAPTSAEARPKETPPTAEQVLDKYVEVLGGKAAIDKLQTRVMKGSWLAANGMTLGYEVYQSGPDKVYTVVSIPQQGVLEKGFDGAIGWEKSSAGIRTLEDPELFYLKRYPDIFKDLKLKEQYTRLSFAGKDKIDEKEVYVLRGTTPDNKRERLYFDVQTGFLLRRSVNVTTMIGVIPEQVDFDDYRDVGGMKLPFTIRVSSIDSFFNSTRKFTEIKLNVPVDATKFTKPAGAEVKSPSR
ncbi:MAG TPA: c-type cytochrome [Pyrinomonadaceae bacterium]|nr:c-type cytochrome [Pyrinomonadaceae bacterium]